MRDLTSAAAVDHAYRAVSCAGAHHGSPVAAVVTSVVLALVCGSLGAQTPTHMSPVAVASMPGNVNNIVPFSRTIHYQQIHDLNSFTSTTAGAWQRMQFIADAATPSGTIDTELFLAECPHPAANVQAPFASNITPGTEIPVFLRKMYNFPSVGAQTWGAVDLPFDVPFVFKGTNHISWRIVIWSNTLVSPTNFVLDCFSDWRFGATVGTGCQHPMGTQNAGLNTTYRSPGNVWDFNLYTWVAGTPMPGFLLIGTSNSSWGGNALPFDLSVIGAPGCNIYNDGAIVVPVVSGTAASGFVGVKATLPSNPLLIGGQIFAQGVWLDPGANPLGMFTTNGRNNAPIPAPNGIARNYSTGNPMATQGGAEKEFAVPVGFL